MAVEKPMVRVFRSQDHYAPELFALELIHEFWRCSIVYSLPRLARSEILLMEHDVEQ